MWLVLVGQWGWLGVLDYILLGLCRLVIWMCCLCFRFFWVGILVWQIFWLLMIQDSGWCFWLMDFCNSIKFCRNVFGWGGQLGMQMFMGRNLLIFWIIEQMLYMLLELVYEFMEMIYLGLSICLQRCWMIGVILMKQVLVMIMKLVWCGDVWIILVLKWVILCGVVKVVVIFMQQYDSLKLQGQSEFL